MGTNSTGCTEWERDFDPVTEQPMARQHNPHAYPPLISKIARAILLEQERMRVFDGRVLYEHEQRIAAWAERVILCGPDNHREHVLRDEAFRLAMVVYRAACESVPEAVGR